jgi:hypothetical protein
MDLEAPPLSDFLEVLPQHFQDWAALEDRVVAAHAAKVVNCNWKVAQEAFLEAYHVKATHPQLAWYNSDENSQYDIYGDNVSRFINLMGSATPELTDVPASQVALNYGEHWGLPDPDSMAVEAEASGDARGVIAKTMKSLLQLGTGVDMEKVSDTAAIDSTEYFLFPNFLPWPVLGIPILYRFRPYKTDPDYCILEAMLMMPVQPGADRPPAAKVYWVEGDDFCEAPGIGALGPAINQDMANLERIQVGLKASRKGAVTLANYQEIRIRHYHKTLMKYVEAED